MIPQSIKTKASLIPWSTYCSGFRLPLWGNPICRRTPRLSECNIHRKQIFQNMIRSSLSRQSHRHNQYFRHISNFPEYTIYHHKWIPSDCGIHLLKYPVNANNLKKLIGSLYHGLYHTPVIFNKIMLLVVRVRGLMELYSMEEKGKVGCAGFNDEFNS